MVSSRQVSFYQMVVNSTFLTSTPPDILSLLRDQVSQYTSAPFNVRIESDVATFYRIPRVLFWDYVSQDKELQDYVNSYYREKLSEAIFRQQIMMMNGKTGAICSFLYQLIDLFGRKVEAGTPMSLS